MKNKEEWISVNDKLPKDKQVVKVKGDFDSERICFFKKLRNFAMFAAGKMPFIFQVFGITHWKSIDMTLEEFFEKYK